MLCLQIQMRELSWTCYTYLGWRSNRADKKAVACLFACRSFNTMLTAFVLVINRHTHTCRFGSFYEGCVRWGSGSSPCSAFFYLLFLLQWNYFTVKLLILQERRVVTKKQSWGTEDVIQLSDIRPEFTSISFTGWIGCSIMQAPQPCWGKGHLLLSFRASHICLHLS